MRYIIWGCGVRGKMAEWLFRDETITAFVDTAVSEEQHQYQNIPIWSPEQFLENYSNENVIITPKNHETEISSWLIEKNIYNFTIWEKEQWPVIAFEKQVSKKRLLNLLDDSKIAVYGYPLLKSRVLKWAGSNNININDICEINSDTVKNVNKIILTGNITKEQEYILKKNQCEYLDFLHLAENLSLVDFGDCNDLKNAYEGKRVFIVATGPSLRVEDLDKLSLHHELCISMNGIYKVFDKTKWRPEFYGISDIVGYTEMEEDILKADIKNKYIMNAMWDEKKHTKENGYYKWHLIVENRMENPRFSSDLLSGFFGGKTVTYDFALQFAVYLGIKEIYLLGVDCNYVKGGTQNHFAESDKPDMYNHEEDKMILAYMSAKKYADTHGIKIYNATRGGKLEVFERVDFDSLFDKDK